MPKFNGILSVIATPFDKNAVVDLQALSDLAEHVLAGGVHAVIPCGTTGEYHALTVDERKAVMTRIVDVVGKRAQLIAGVNSSRPADIIELGLYAKSLGFEALLLAAPYYSLPSESDLVAHFAMVAANVKLPIMLYNFPARTGVDMTPTFLDGIRDVPEIVAIKESGGSIARMYDHVVNRSDQLELVCGSDDQALDFFLWGATSWVAGASNILPAEHVALYETCVKNRDFVRGRAIMDKLLPLFLLMEGGGKYLQYVKYGCELNGLPIGDVRPPLGALTDADKATFATLFKAARGVGL